MNSLFFWLAGALSAVWFAVHLFVGGRQIAQPLLQATALDPLVRNTQYLCWHFTSVAIAAMAGFFFWGAYAGVSAFAVAGTVLASGFFVVGVGLVFGMKENHLTLPQGWLFVPVTVLGLVGLIS